MSARLRIDYGVHSEGRGHASRAVFLLPRLLEAGYAVRVHASADTLDWISRRVSGVEAVEIPSLRFVYRNNRLSRWRTGLGFVRQAGAAWRCGQVLDRHLRADPPLAVISDYEAFTARAANRARVPLLAFDHQQVVDGMAGLRSLPMRCLNARVYGRPRQRVVSSFYFPERLPRPGETRVGPLLRDAVFSRQAHSGGHVLVYQTSDTLEALPRLLASLPGEKRVYGARMVEGPDLRCCPPDPDRFLEDLATCAFAVVNGGYSTISEALYYGKPLLCLPVLGQTEQELNAAAVQSLGFGEVLRLRRGRVPDLSGFLASLDGFRMRILSTAPPPGNDAAARAVLGFLARLRDGRTA